MVPPHIVRLQDFDFGICTKDSAVSPAKANQILWARTWRNCVSHLKVPNNLMIHVTDKTYARGNPGTHTHHSRWCVVSQDVHSDEHNSVSAPVSRPPYIGKVPTVLPSLVAELSGSRLTQIPGLLLQALANSSTGYLRAEYAGKVWHWETQVLLAL